MYSWGFVKQIFGGIMLRIFLVMIFCTSYLFAQQEANPLIPGRSIHAAAIGLSGGSSFLLSPSILTNIPTKALSTTQKSLSNGLNGLGYNATFNVGILAKFPIKGDFWLGGGLNYSSWSSKSNCSCKDIFTYNSENTLTNIQVSVNAYYYFDSFSKIVFYVEPEINLNLLNAEATETASKRGTLDFSKMYPRIGAGIGLGSEIPLTKNIGIDFNVKYQMLNLLLGKENKEINYTTESESVINEENNKKEAIISVFSINIGLIYLF
jgi:hypothetical protein